MLYYEQMEDTIKHKLKAYCIQHTEARIAEIVYAKQQSQESLESDTKSSAGDKYETSREMIQQDLTRYQVQLLQAQQDLGLLQQLHLKKEQPVVTLGSLVKTDKGFYFIAISLGNIKLEDKPYIVISASSPIGKLFFGKAAGEHIVFNGSQQEILEIS